MTAGDPQPASEARVGHVSDADISALCVECGLCCSGVLFDLAPTTSSDDEIVARLGLKPVSTDEGGRGFALPCPLLSNSCCSVYGQTRPAVCGDFFCKLARRTRQGRVPMTEARSRVQEARRLSAATLAFHPPGTSATAARRHANRLAGSVPEDAETRRFLLANAMLQSYLERYFR